MPTPDITQVEQTPPTDFQQPPTPVTEPIKSASKLPLIIMAVLLIITTSAAAYFYSQSQTTTSLPAATTSPTPSTNPTNDWKTYTNKIKNYSIQYPSAWRVDTSEAELSSDAKLTIFKDEYKITILWPSAFGPGICVFDDQDRTTAPDMASYCEGEYKQFLSNNSQETHRRLVNPNKYFEWSVYTLESENFVTAPPIKYQSPTDYDLDQIAIMDQILSTYQVNQQSDPTSDTSNWQIYKNQSVGFSIKYPSGWREQEGPAMVGFGPREVGEDVLIGINYYQKANNKLSEIIDQIGSQFKDRVVIQDNIVINTALIKRVTVTTPSHPDWYSETIIFETPNAFITISNGAVKNENYPFDRGVPTGFTFEQFYSTFQFTEQAPAVIDTTSWQTYTNQDFNYKIKYSEEWQLRKTYGPNIEKLAPTDILSGTDLHLYRGDYFYANVNVNLLDAKGEQSIDNWITKYDLNYPKAAAVKKVSFNQVSANEYTHQPSGTRISKVLYFIKNGYAYKIWFWGDNQENFNQAEALVETFLTE